jgi:CubicO group peptidase (beta-lactamase class C family)
MGDPNGDVRELLENLVSSGGEIGLQVAAYLDGRLVVDAWAGLADETSSRPVDGETLFTAFSISKGIAATCVHILADRGLLDYDAPIAEYWPEFAAKGKERATLRHALTHRVGIPQDPPGFEMGMAADWDAVCRATAELEPLWEPGTRSGYHPLTYGWMLGEIVRRVDGRPIGRFLREDVCRPLGIEGMHFGIPPDLEPRVATLRNAPGTGKVDASMNPSLLDPAGTFNRPEVRRATIPGAGAIVNARSLARHYAMLAGGGELDGVRLLSEERVRTVRSLDWLGVDPILASFWTEETPWALGYMMGGWRGPMAGRPNAFGYDGPGTIGFADPERRFAFAFLKNLVDLSPRMHDSSTLVARAVERLLGIGDSRE